MIVKNILLILLSFLSLNLFCQVERQPNLTGKFFSSQSGGGTGFWQISGNFSDDSGVHDASSVEVGDMVFFSDGGFTFFLPITEIVSALHPSLVVKVSNVGISQISSVPSGMKAIYHPTSKGYFPYVAGLSNPDQQVYNEYLIYLLEQNNGGSGSGKINKSYLVNRTNLILSDSTTVLSEFNTVVIDVIRSTENGSVTLPLITEDLKNTIFIIQGWVEEGGNNIGIFSSGETFINGFSGGSFTNQPFITLKNKEKAIITPVLDSGVWYWSTHISEKVEPYFEYLNLKNLYVSKSLGDNSTAEVGNPNKPFADPWAAKDVAEFGDEIFVLDGVWRYGAGEEIEQSESNRLIKDGITYHFYPKTKIILNMIDDGTESQLLSDEGEKSMCKILGSLSIIQNMNSLNWSNNTLALPNNDSSYLVLELDTLNAAFNCPSCVTAAHKFKSKLDLKIENLIIRELYDEADETNLDYFLLKGGVNNIKINSQSGLAAFFQIKGANAFLDASFKGDSVAIFITDTARANVNFNTDYASVGSSYFANTNAVINSVKSFFVNSLVNGRGNITVNNSTVTGNNCRILSNSSSSVTLKLNNHTQPVGLNLYSDPTSRIIVSGNVDFNGSGSFNVRGADNAKVFLNSIIMFNPPLLTNTISNSFTDNTNLYLSNCFCLGTPNIQITGITLFGEPITTY